MVTDEKIINTVLARYRLGNVLIWLGVMTWLSFIVLRIVGEKPSIFLFLPFHLMGVLGGSRMRSLARKELGLTAPKKNALRTAGHSLIFIGILVWLPYFYLKLIAQRSVDVMNFLPYHLTGVLTGVGFLVLSYLVSQGEP